MSRVAWFAAAMAAVASSVSAVTGAAAADKFPSRPITLIVPFTAGGPVDLTMRALAAHAEKVLGQPMVIDVKPGAGATLGPATMAATAKPDGYTISNLSVGIFSVPFMQKVTFDPAKDFTYIIHLSGYRGHFVVRPDAKWKTFKEFVADAKAHPHTITYASTGAGAAPHLNMESISLAAGFKLVHVPFRGNSELIAAILGGHVDVLTSSGTVVPLVESGQLRSLMVTTPDRNPRFPDLPSLADEGIKPLIDPANPFGIGGPKGMPADVVKILHDALKEAFYSPEHQQLMKQLDLQDRYLDSEHYREYAMQQIQSYGKLVKQIGLERK